MKTLSVARRKIPERYCHRCTTGATSNLALKVERQNQIDCHSISFCLLETKREEIRAATGIEWNLKEETNVVESRVIRQEGSEEAISRHRPMRYPADWKRPSIWPGQSVSGQRVWEELSQQEAGPREGVQDQPGRQHAAAGVNTHRDIVMEPAQYVEAERCSSYWCWKCRRATRSSPRYSPSQITSLYKDSTFSQLRGSVQTPRINVLRLQTGIVEQIISLSMLSMPSGSSRRSTCPLKAKTTDCHQCRGRGRRYSKSNIFSSRWFLFISFFQIKLTGSVASRNLHRCTISLHSTSWRNRSTTTTW